MPIRCLENKVYAITANRTGREQRKEGSCLEFIGKSQIVAPDSTIIAKAPKKWTSLMIADLKIDTALNKSINQYNDLFKDRRPEMYQVLVEQEKNDP